MNYHSRQQSSEVQIVTLSSVLCILVCANLCTAPASLPSQRPTSCSALDITWVLRMHGSCLMAHAPARLQRDWQHLAVFSRLG